MAAVRMAKYILRVLLAINFSALCLTHYINVPILFLIKILGLSENGNERF
jgi:hypothetical protein